MTARRLALWWRLVLAAGVLALPVATATTPAAAVVASPHYSPAAYAAPTPSAAGPVAQIHHSRHGHRSAPMLAAVAAGGVAFVVFLLSTGLGRRRTSQLMGDVRHWWSSRAPPTRTSCLVPFGLAPGSAGRFSRSRRALVACTTRTSV